MKREVMRKILDALHDEASRQRQISREGEDIAKRVSLVRLGRIDMALVVLKSVADDCVEAD